MGLFFTIKILEMGVFLMMKNLLKGGLSHCHLRAWEYNANASEPPGQLNWPSYLPPLYLVNFINYVVCVYLYNQNKFIVIVHVCVSVLAITIHIHKISNVYGFIC